MVLMTLSACGIMDGNSSRCPLEYRMKVVNRVYEEQGKASEETYCKFRLPVFSRGEHAAVINRYLMGWIAGSTVFEAGFTHGDSPTMGELADYFFSVYEKERKEFPVNWPYQFELDGSVLLNRPGLVSLDLSFYAFTGGAHGNSHTENFVFNTATGKRLGLNDVFVTGFEAPLNKLIDSRFRKMRGLSPAERLDGEQGMLFENSIRFNDNLALTDKGIRFHYNPYEIAAYAFGSTVVNIPYSELEGLLKPEFMP